MTVTTGLCTRSTVARWAGGMYLAYILASVLASRLGHIGLSDAPTLRATIFGDEAMFRLGLVAALASALLFVLTAWALYALLRPVREPLALLLLVLNAVGVAVQCASYLPLLAVLAQGDSAVDVQAFTGPQLDGLALLSITIYRRDRPPPALEGRQPADEPHDPHRRRYPDPPWQNTRPPLNLR